MNLPHKSGVVTVTSRSKRTPARAKTVQLLQNSTILSFCKLFKTLMDRSTSSRRSSGDVNENIIKGPVTLRLYRSLVPGNTLAESHLTWRGAPSCARRACDARAAALHR